MLSIVPLLNEIHYLRTISKLTKDNDRLFFALQVLAKNFSGLCCVCVWDPEKTGEECPVRKSGTLVECVSWLVDGANQQRENES